MPGKRPDIATAQKQRQQPNIRLSCSSDGVRGMNSKYDGACKRSEEETSTAPQVGTPEADGAQEMASIGNRCVPPLTGSALPLPRRGLQQGKEEEEAQRPRPWVIQKYLRPKGPLSWYVENVDVLFECPGSSFVLETNRVGIAEALQPFLGWCYAFLVYGAEGTCSVCFWFFHRFLYTAPVKPSKQIVSTTGGQRVTTSCASPCTPGHDPNQHPIICWLLSVVRWL